MATRPPAIGEPGSAPEGVLSWLRGWASTVRQWIRARDPAETTVGSAQDKFVTRGELLDLGLYRLNADGSFAGGGGSGGGTTIIYVPGGGGSGDTPDLTPPPTPTGFDGRAGFSEIVLLWDAPGYGMGHGHLRTRIYAAIWGAGEAEPTFADPRTKLVDTAEGPTTLKAYAAQLATTYCFWITWQTVDGVESSAPAGGIHGLQLTTGQDIAALQQLLIGKITHSQLYYDLARPIGRLDLVNDEMAATMLEAQLTLAQEAQNRAAGLLAEARERGTALVTVQRIVDEGITQSVRLVNTLTAKVDGNHVTALAAVQAESEARADGDEAEATQRLLLAAELQDPVTGLAATRATLAADYTTTVGMEEAIAASAVTITAAFNEADASTLASAQAFTYSRATIDGAISSAVTNVRAEYQDGDDTLTAAISAEATVRADQTGYLGAQYNVRADINGFVVGYGFSATSAPGAGTTSDFMVRSDRFSVVPPTQHTGPTAPAAPALNDRWYRTTDRVILRWDGSAWVVFNSLPFTIQASPTTINGVTIPAGMYVEAAYILNLQAQYAQIAHLVADSITTAELSAAQLTAGDGTIGGRLKSAAFSSGSAGWIIRPDGTAEFNDIVARGEIYAPAALIQGLLTAGQINARGIVITRASDGRVVFDANDDSPPWVVAVANQGAGIDLVEPATTENTARIRSVQAGNGIVLTVQADGSIRFDSKSSDDSAVRLPADATSTSTTPANVTGVYLTLEANSSYRIEGTLLFRTGAQTTGLKLQASIPTAATGAMRVTANVSETAQESRQAYFPSGGSQAITMSGSWAAQPGSPSTFSATADGIASIEAIVNTGGSAGSFQLALGTSAGGSAVTLRPGSVILAERVTTDAPSGSFSLAGSPGLEAAYSALSAPPAGKPAYVGVRITLKPDGTWTVTREGIFSGWNSTYTLSGSWSSPTGTGAGAQWQVKYVPGAATDAIVSNGAPTFQALNADRSIVVAISADALNPIASDLVPVAIVLRNAATGAETTLATVDIEVEADAP